MICEDLFRPFNEASSICESTEQRILNYAESNGIPLNVFTEGIIFDLTKKTFVKFFKMVKASILKIWHSVVNFIKKMIDKVKSFFKMLYSKITGNDVKLTKPMKVSMVKFNSDGSYYENIKSIYTEKELKRYFDDNIVSLSKVVKELTDNNISSMDTLEKLNESGYCDEKYVQDIVIETYNTLSMLPINEVRIVYNGDTAHYADGSSTEMPKELMDRAKKIHAERLKTVDTSNMSKEEKIMFDLETEVIRTTNHQTFVLLDKDGWATTDIDKADRNNVYGVHVSYFGKDFLDHINLTEMTLLDDNRARAVLLSKNFARDYQALCMDNIKEARAHAEKYDLEFTLWFLGRYDHAVKYLGLNEDEAWKYIYSKRCGYFEDNEELTKELLKLRINHNQATVRAINKILRVNDSLAALIKTQFDLKTRRINSSKEASEIVGAISHEVFYNFDKYYKDNILDLRKFDMGFALIDKNSEDIVSRAMGHNETNFKRLIMILLRYDFTFICHGVPGDNYDTWEFMHPVNMPDGRIIKNIDEFFEWVIDNHKKYNIKTVAVYSCNTADYKIPDKYLKNKANVTFQISHFTISG